MGMIFLAYIPKTKNKIDVWHVSGQIKVLYIVNTAFVCATKLYNKVITVVSSDCMKELNYRKSKK